MINDGGARAVWIWEAPMKLFLYSFALAVIAAGLSYGQATLTQIPVSAGTLQTGFAVFTPLRGTGGGLTVPKVFRERIVRSFFQQGVVASQRILLTGFPVNENLAQALAIGS